MVCRLNSAKPVSNPVLKLRSLFKTFVNKRLLASHEITHTYIYIYNIHGSKIIRCCNVWGPRKTYQLAVPNVKTRVRIACQVFFEGWKQAVQWYQEKVVKCSTKKRRYEFRGWIPTTTPFLSTRTSTTNVVACITIEWRQLAFFFFIKSIIPTYMKW